MTAPHELRTARLLLRSTDREDIPAMVRLAGAREVAATTARMPHPYTSEDAIGFLTQAEENYRSGLSVFFAITILPEPEFRGGISLDITPQHRRAELGYWIGVPDWGRGYATEAAAAVIAFGFENLQLNRIHADHFAGNIGSQRVLEKIGMRHEGISRQHISRWDRWIDLENYGLLAEQFRRAHDSENQ